MLFETGRMDCFQGYLQCAHPTHWRGRSSNLCTEITLNTSAGEIAVCNLSSINLVQHIENGELNLQEPEGLRAQQYALDNVIDINYYSVEQARALTCVIVL